ncbi:TerD family protein [Clostridium estertheticum]|uniref:TerD family protein n=1 Tax=Clostridium estertheticum TaxID=238834 RepID=UPI001C7DBC50|nr:TerD family protein [Clostridium estertheticum]MBX4261836.1 TerD family protein [Clostridium estertheticum]WLC71260.1 TerD family protein [Clostridium estertheticum]
MGINLTKGQRVNLTKDNPGLKKTMVGLGWDPVQQASKGLIGGLFGGKQAQIDCDASVFMLDENNKLRGKNDMVYFGNLKSKCGSVQHMGDNLTGDGDGDDEQIMVDLHKIPQDIAKLVFVVNIYAAIERKQHFGMIQNAFIRLVNITDNKEMLRFNLTEGYSGKTGLFVAEIYRNNGEWKFTAVGEADASSGLGQMAKRYQ